MSVTAVPLRPVRKGSVLKLWIGLAGLAAIAAGVAWAGTEKLVQSDPATFLARNKGEEGVVTTPSGLQIKTLRAGRGPRIGINDGAMVHYEGSLLDGTVFETTEGKQPVPMLVRQMVPGFAEALQQMQPGGKYQIWLPPELGYGSEVPPDGPIPPNAVLSFEMTIVQVVPDAALQMPGGVGGAPPGGM